MITDNTVASTSSHGTWRTACPTTSSSTPPSPPMRCSTTTGTAPTASGGKTKPTFTGTRAKLVADDDGRLFLIYGDATNVRIAAANPADDPEATPSISWNDWAPLELSGALPDGQAEIINTIIDLQRWKTDRILSVYAQETNVTGTATHPLHVLDYHVSAPPPVPSRNAATYNGFEPRS